MELIGTGVKGLDDMLGGGIPKNHVVTVLGAFGTGKTTLALQFISEGLNRGEKCIFITLEETVDSIKKNALAFGWDLQRFQDEGTLAVVKLEPADVKTTLTRVKSELPEFIGKFEADRIAIDSISLLNMMFPDEVERRTHLFALYQQIKSTGTTALLTAEAKDENPRSSRDGLVEYVSDGVIILMFNEPEGSKETQLVVQVVKVRRRKHSRQRKPYLITSHGLEVHTEADVF
ncbi:MAG: KaiC domain-containing protein [Thermoplasmata archaeon]